MRQTAHKSDRGSRTSWARIVVRLGIAVALLASVLAGFPGTGAAAAGQDGKAIFGQLCQGCHTIGGGKLVGPDLAGVSDRVTLDWAKQFILAPDKVIASGDPKAKELLSQYGTPMPNLGVTEAQIGPLLTFLGFKSSTTTTTTPAPSTTPSPAPVAGDAEAGKSLFRGSQRFAAGGPSCLSCHSVAGVGALGGGQLGPDLTGAFAKYGGEQGLRAALTSIPFPTMAPIFSRKPLTAAERSDLIAFLASAPDRQRPARSAGKLLALSAAAVVFVALLGFGIWPKRLNGVRKPLVDRSTRK